MSTLHSLPNPAPVSSPPGIALVRSLDTPPSLRSTQWERAVQRLCLYVLPSISALSLSAAFRLASASHASYSPIMQFDWVLSFAWIAAIECFQATKCEQTNQEHTGAMAVMVSVCAAFGAALLLLVLLGLHMPGILFCATDAAFLFFASVIIKTSFRTHLYTHSPLIRIIVVDTHVNAGEVSWTLTRRGVSRHEISGAIRLEGLKDSHIVNIAHNVDELVREIEREQAEGVLISASSAEIALLSERIGARGSAGAPVRFIVNPKDATLPRRHFSNVSCLYLLNIGAEPTTAMQYTILKKTFDIVFSLAAIICGLPLIVPICIAVMISSKGSVFFAQDRVGWNGKVFRIYKFRTMRESPPAESDTRWSQHDDVRRTMVGRFLRKYSLDELPQFLNVLKGDMSVVGPRPERPYFVNSFRRDIDEYQRRHQIKVGITGWAQVNGLRGDTCIRTRLMYDLYYLQNWGLVFDLKIILRTVLCVLCGKNSD